MTIKENVNLFNKILNDCEIQKYGYCNKEVIKCLKREYKGLLLQIRNSLIGISVDLILVNDVLETINDFEREISRNNIDCFNEINSLFQKLKSILKDIIYPKS